MNSVEHIYNVSSGAHQTIYPDKADPCAHLLTIFLGSWTRYQQAQKKFRANLYTADFDQYLTEDLEKKYTELQNECRKKTFSLKTSEQGRQPITNSAELIFKLSKIFFRSQAHPAKELSCSERLQEFYMSTLSGYQNRKECYDSIAFHDEQAWNGTRDPRDLRPQPRYCEEFLDQSKELFIQLKKSCKGMVLSTKIECVL